MDYKDELSEFNDIRPYESGEMRQAFEELLGDRQFQLVLKGFVPWLPKSVRNGLLRLAFTGVKTPLDFQKRFMKPVVNYIIRKHTDGCTFDDAMLKGNHNSSHSEAAEPSAQYSIPNSQFDKRYTFVSNHRDIVLDSAFLDVMLVNGGYPTTVEIGIGDNLLIYPWIKRLVRMNKAFTVRRGLTPHEMLRSSQLMSRYIHYAVTQKHENIWIAQREGRAKDSDDRTQDAVLKMLAMGGPRIENGELKMEIYDMPQGGKQTEESGVQGNQAEESGVQGNHNSQFSTLNSQFQSSLRELNIVPLTISYEYDPCDYLKAQEFQQKRDNPAFKKSRQDDLDNMKTGIFGYKGRVSYHCGRPVNTWMDELDGSLPRNEFFAQLAHRMDLEIHRGYQLYPCNYIAADMLGAESRYAEHYTAEDRQRFCQYLEGQLAKVTIPNKDEAFLRERILTMYANPLVNHNAATS
ncbi:MAG: acyltransferase [Prevotella sp.]|nr:acyltransferase [Prevotella sp.]